MIRRDNRSLRFGAAVWKIRFSKNSITGIESQVADLDPSGSAWPRAMTSGSCRRCVPRAIKVMPASGDESPGEQYTP